MSALPQSLRPSVFLNFASSGFLVVWCIIASFPMIWISLMSFKSPLDAFSDGFWSVVVGPQTISQGKYISALDVIIAIVMVIVAFKIAPNLVRKFERSVHKALAWTIAMGLSLVMIVLIPSVASIFDSIFSLIPGVNIITRPFLGMTLEHYQSVWVENTFYRQFLNSLMVTVGVVSVSLTVGTLAGYALARSDSSLAFWLLIIALVFRALPHSVLVTGYLPFFINSADILEPILEEGAPTLYGSRIAVIMVLVSINQPFTIWMLRSFFRKIPAELDEAARVDGCTHFGAFFRVIIPVMWPGVITAGLFSFLLAYNDYLVTSLLLNAENQTMVPAISGYFNRETTTTDQIEAVSAAVSITAPLFVLVMVFQRQIVAGLTAGAVKG